MLNSRDNRRQAASDQSGDKAPHSKIAAVSFGLSPASLDDKLKCVGHQGDAPK